MLIGYAIIFFVLLVQHVVHAQETGIDCSQASNDWVKCFSTNLGTCSFCFLGVPADNPTCDDYKLAYCPLTECCSQCAEEAAFYAQCTANSWTDATQQSECNLGCSGTGQSSTSDASTTRGILVLTAVIVMEVIGQTTLF